MKHTIAAALSLTVALLACSDSAGPGSGALTFAEVSALSSMALHAGTATSLASTPSAAISASGCPFNSGTQRFVCPTVTAGGFTVNLYYQLLDAAGSAQTGFNPTTTASMHTVRDVSGTITLSGATVPVTEHLELTLTGIQTANRVVNGAGTGTGTTALGTISMTETITNVVFPPRGSATPYPTSGTIAVHVNAPAALPDSDVLITFNGTASVPVVITGVANQTCTLNLAAPGSALSC